MQRVFFVSVIKTEISLKKDSRIFCLLHFTVAANCSCAFSVNLSRGIFLKKNNLPTGVKLKENDDNKNCR